MNDIVKYILQFIVILFALSIHEAAHAWVALKCGDSTAKNLGRCTLNPKAHIDLIGTIIFPIFLAIMHAPVFGWAKPVPVNPNNLRNYRRGNRLVSAAGPASNLLVALASIILYKILIFIGIISPGSLDGGGQISISLFLFLFYMVLINVYLAVFNLIPIPPLDGSGILESVLKGDALIQYHKLRPYGFIILIGIIYLGILDIIASPILKFVMSIFL
jgi:Zn-dependent protease